MQDLGFQNLRLQPPSSRDIYRAAVRVKQINTQKALETKPGTWSALGNVSYY